MIAIPLTKKISWRNPPIFTIAIILVNVFVLFVIQGKDDERFMEAHSFYFESSLDHIEIPMYLDFLKIHHPEKHSEIDIAEVETNPRLRMMLYQMLNFDAPFLALLKSGEIGLDDPYEKDRHESLRLEYDALQERIVSLHYGFRPARPRAETWLTTMFLHGGTGHLVGNMIFLWLIGCMIEYGCRRWLFVVIYGLGGLAATGFFWLLNMDSLIPLIGASGAIAGIMGAFTVLYGFKRVRIFLNLGFYFNYLKFPAIVMLPLWIGNEVFQMVTNEGSGVAYAAHLGGLLGGSALACLARRVPNLLDMEGFEDAQDDPVQPMVEKALEHMGKLEFSEARALLVRAEALQPEDTVILKHLFTIDSQEPEAQDFQRTSQKLLDTLCKQEETYDEAHRVYRDYVRAARPPKLGIRMYLLLCRVFCEIGKLDDAQRLVSVLVKKRPELEEIPALLLKLAGLHAKSGNHQTRLACLNCVAKKYPMSSEARIAKKQLGAAVKNQVN